MISHRIHGYPKSKVHQNHDADCLDFIPRLFAILRAAKPSIRWMSHAPTNKTVAEYGNGSAALLTERKNSRGPKFWFSGDTASTGSTISMKKIINISKAVQCLRANDASSAIISRIWKPGILVCTLEAPEVLTVSFWTCPPGKQHDISNSCLQCKGF